MTSAPDRTPTAPLAHQDVLVLDYLAALWAATEDLPPDLRDELMSTAAEYIAARRAAAGPVDDTALIVRRLGPPEDLAAAVRRGRLPVHLTAVTAPPPAAPTAPAPARATGDHAGIALLTAGALVLPVLGPLAGMLLVTASDRWSPMQKAAAWVLTTGSVPFGMLVLALTAEGGAWFALVLAYLATACGSAVAGLTLVPGLSRERPR
jgi:uncharacterized membrane protein